jgi:transcriptional regulator with GAF, ATPase, and Fis domain
MPAEAQTRLLRALQSGRIRRVGGRQEIAVNVRIIAATNRDLTPMIAAGTFREDLFYRLNVFPIEVPPLRERVEDIPLLVWAFLGEFSSRMGKKVTQISRRTMEQLQQETWHGNVRELRNVIERAVILSTNEVLRIPEQSTPAPTQGTATLANNERQHILATLERTGWRIKGPKGAAVALGVPPSTLYSRMRQLNIPVKRELGPQ